MAKMRAEAKNQLVAVQAELQQLRRAASGDPCGWIECEDGSFSNMETGETGVKSMPDTLAFACAIKRVDSLGAHEEVARAAQKNAQNAETKRREMDVKLNKARSDAHAQRDLLDSWNATAKSIAATLSRHTSNSESTFDVLLLQRNNISKYSDRIKQITSKVCHTTASIQALRDALVLAEAKNAKLQAEVTQLDTSTQKTQAELAALRHSLNHAVEAEVQPMRIEMSRSRDVLSRERLARVIERRQLAALWPSTVQPVPVALRRHIQVSQDERTRLLDAACTAAAEAEIKREIRRRVADAARWSEKIDDYGRKYYVHSDTAEAAWEPPPAMLHKTESSPGNCIVGDLALQV
mmetsp:Transcript_30676/g.94872  ORF Transcript_30676/g.94872 Transcript_30676/m.94872 type:complete len:351 (+) Transcript_30676:590-1642(+)